MIKILYVIAFLVVGTLFPSCKNQLFEQIERLQSVPVDLSACDNSVCFNRGYEFEAHIVDSLYKLIVYVDSFSCSQCFISHMIEVENCFKEFESLSVKSILIIEPSEVKMKEIKTLLRKNRYPFDIILVENSAFSKANSHLPSSSILRSFLLTPNNDVVVVGDPTRNIKIKELMQNTLKEKQKYSLLNQIGADSLLSKEKSRRTSNKKEPFSSR